MNSLEEPPNSIDDGDGSALATFVLPILPRPLQSLCQGPPDQQNVVRRLIDLHVLRQDHHPASEADDTTVLQTPGDLAGHSFPEDHPGRLPARPSHHEPAFRALQEPRLLS